LIGAAVVCSNGCAMPATEANDLPAQKDIGESKSPVVVGSATDGSGLITVTFYSCAMSASASPTAGQLCGVGPDELVVGGGAILSRNSAVALAGSVPFGKQYWIAIGAALDGGELAIATYAIGLKLAGITGEQLRAMAVIKTNQSATEQHPQTYVAVDAGYVMVGGGALASPTGQYLYYNYPENWRWVAASKDHGVYAPGIVTAYLIEIPTHPSGFPLDIHNLALSSSWDGFTTTGVATNYVFSPNGWATSSLGGRASWSGAGRLLMNHQLLTNGQGGNIATSSDAFWPDSGKTWAYALSLLAY
jgi:hypothetical protein